MLSGTHPDPNKGSEPPALRLLLCASAQSAVIGSARPQSARFGVQRSAAIGPIRLQSVRFGYNRSDSATIGHVRVCSGYLGNYCPDSVTIGSTRAHSAIIDRLGCYRLRSPRLGAGRCRAQAQCVLPPP